MHPQAWKTGHFWLRGHDRQTASISALPFFSQQPVTGHLGCGLAPGMMLMTMNGFA
jgi:hypothetical protein